MSPSRPTARRPSERRDGALRAAMTVIAERGVEQTRYRDVADASGVPVATLQYMFGSLENLVLEALVWEADRYRHESRAVLAAIADPWERIETLIDRSVGIDEPTAVHRRRWRLWLEAWHTATRVPAMRARLADNSREYHEMLVEILRDGRAAGSFVAEPDLEDAAAEVYGVIDGIGVDLILQAEDPDYERVRGLMLDAIRRILRPD